jgi:hypothetical protein
MQRRDLHALRGESHDPILLLHPGDELIELRSPPMKPRPTASAGLIQPEASGHSRRDRSRQTGQASDGDAGG